MTDGHVKYSLWAVLATAAVVALGGCQPGGRVDGGKSPEPPDVDAILTAHNINAQRLKQIDAAGVLQIRWVDENGRTREEQGEAELWIDKPRHIALRVSKLGEELLWIGSNDERFWLFDSLDDDNVALITRRHGSALVWGSDDDAIELQPLALLDLMAITSLTATDDEPTYDSGRRCWLLPVDGAAGRMHLRWNPAARLIEGLDLLDARQKVRLSSDLRRRAPVDLIDDVAFERPQMATIIDFNDPNGPGRLKLALGQQIFGDLSEQPVDRIFDLSVLRQRFQPRHVDGDVE